MSDYNYEGGVCLIHYSNDSISDENCIVKCTTKNDSVLGEARLGSWFRQRTRLIEFYGNISNMYISQFMFSQCYSLKRANISSTKKVEDGTVEGTWKNANILQHTFRMVPGIKKQHIKFPNLTLANSNFYDTGIEEIKSDYRSVVRFRNEYENCKNLKKVELQGGLHNMIWGTSGFRNCFQLTSFEYDLPRLLTGVGMFEGCKLDKASVERILYSLPNIANLKKATTNSVITEGVKDGNTTYPYWGRIKENGVWKDVAHELDISKNSPTEETKQLIARVYNNASAGVVTIHYKSTARKANEKGNGSEIIWYWNQTTISKDDIGILDIGMATGVKEQVNDALIYANQRGWTINIK